MNKSTDQPMPRRLAPQRNRKPAPPSKVESDASKSVPLPIDISLDIGGADEGGGNGEDYDPLITKTMADWTLNETTDQIIQPQDISDDNDEEQSYHGEIESHESESQSSSAASQEEIETPDGYAPTSLDDISTSSPPTSPLVLVNLERLCGCKPEVGDREVLINQLTDALYGDSLEEPDNNHERNSEGLEFDTRVVELFESGIGSHIDSGTDVVNQITLLDKSNGDAEQEEKSNQSETIVENVSSLAIIPYPEFLSDSSKLQSTARLWKLLHTPHPLPIIERLFKHLINTSRSLFWKVEMHNQLRLLVIDEHKSMVKRLADREYDEWRAVRKERLEKLYEVRETFLLRVDMARERYEKFVEERERRVDAEMTRRRGNLWIESKKVDEHDNCDDEESDPFDIDPTYDDDGWGGVIKEDDIIGEVENLQILTSSEHYPHHDEDDVSESNEEWSPVVVKDSSNPVGMSVVVEDKNEDTKQPKSESSRINAAKKIDKLEPITADDNLHRKSKRKEKAANHSISETSIAEEVSIVREKLKTTDELMAEAMLRNLQTRLDGVDNLLENIQEEEWADEEDAELPCSGPRVEEQTTDPSELTLLDQILAMILGSLSQTFSGAKSEEEHFKFIKEEHESILNEWKDTFGRLPNKIPVEAIVNEMAEVHNNDYNSVSKDDLKAVGNDDKAWDEVDWDTLIP